VNQQPLIDLQEQIGAGGGSSVNRVE
jgi:hypothetical protein